MNPHAPTPPDGRFCVLLIEEDATVAKLVTAALTGAGQEVDWISNSEEGLARFKEKNHHLVLLDLQLTGMSGRDVCCKIRELSAVPVIIITALNGSEDQLLGFRVGADDYLIKPLDQRHLVLRVVAMLRRVYRYDRMTAAPQATATSQAKAAPPAKTPAVKTPATPRPKKRAQGHATRTTSLRDALSQQGITEVPEQAASGLPSGWGGCESCGYMGPHFKFEPEDKESRASIACPVCESHQIVFGI